MPKCFTYLWKNDEWERKRKSTDHRLTYAASDQFLERGVRPGSVLYIVTVKNGSMYVGGTIQVADVLDRTRAGAYLGTDPDRLWQANQYAVCARNSAFVFLPDNKLDTHVVSSLEFADGPGFRNLKIGSDGKLDRQTLRGIRELYGDAHLKLDAHLY